MLSWVPGDHCGTKIVERLIGNSTTSIGFQVVVLLKDRPALFFTGPH
jgi:hypothetical protein